MDLFDDLPEPSQACAPVSVSRQNTTTKEEEEEEEEGEEDDRRRSKRKQHHDDDDDEEEEMKKVCKALPVLRGFVAARRGERDEMQDAHVLLPDFTSLLTATPTHVSRVSYFAVFDGHGGARASHFAAENLHVALSRTFPSADTPPEKMERRVRKSLMEAFRRTDEEFLRKASSQKPAWKDGSTVICVLIVDEDLYVANLGDSRALLCRTETAADGERRSVTLPLSREHNPTIYEERMRIQRAGGSVRDGRVLGVLEVSRSIGDGQFKRCGVVSTPDLRRCHLSGNDRFVLLACDGLFKVFNANEAVEFVLGVLKDQVEGVELGFEAACQQLASEAVRRGSADNVTVVLVPIGC